MTMFRANTSYSNPVPADWAARAQNTLTRGDTPANALAPRCHRP